jgi:hypothetical protein
MYGITLLRKSLCTNMSSVKKCKTSLEMHSWFIHYREIMMFGQLMFKVSLKKMLSSLIYQQFGITGYNQKPSKHSERQATMINTLNSRVKEKYSTTQEYLVLLPRLVMIRTGISGKYLVILEMRLLG